MWDPSQCEIKDRRTVYLYYKVRELTALTLFHPYQLDESTSKFRGV